MIEPAPPKAGEPLRASWAGRLVAFVRSLRVTAGPGIVARRTASGTVVSLAAGPGLRPPDRPRLFDVRVMGDPYDPVASAAHVFVYLPPDGDGWGAAGGGRAYVSVGGVTASYDSDLGQALGSIDEPWVDLGAAGQAGWEVRLRLRFAGGTWFWRLLLVDLTTGATPPPAQVAATEPLPDVLIAERPRKWRVQTRPPAIRQVRSGRIEAAAGFPLTDEGLDRLRGRAGGFGVTTRTVEEVNGLITLRGASSPGSASNQLNSGESVAGVPVLVSATDPDGNAMNVLKWLRPADFIAALNLQTQS